MTRYFDLKKLFLTGFLVFCGCGLPPGISPAPPFYSIAVSPTPISGPASAVSTGFSPNPQVAADGNNNVFVVWQDHTGSIFYTYSTNAGSFFSTPVSVPGSSGGSYPRIATDGSGNLFVTWFTSGTPSSIQFNYAVANSFLPAPLTVSTAPANAPFGLPPTPPQEDINFTSGTLAFAWSQCITSACASLDYEIYTDTIPITQPLTTNPITSASFTTRVQITNSGSGFFAGYPRIKQAGNQPYIQYFQSSATATGLFLYGSNAMTFQINSTVSYNSSLDIDSTGRIVSAWNPVPPFPSNPSFDIFTSFLPPGTGKLFSPFQNITNNRASYGPALAIDSSGYFNLAFFSKSAGQAMNDVFLTRSTDGGVTFPSFYNLSMTPTGNSSSYAPGFTIVGKTAYLVWDEAVTVGAFTTSQIYFEKLTLN